MASAITDFCGLRADMAMVERAAAVANRAPKNRPAPLGQQVTSLDRMLGGGLQRGALHEIVPASPRDEAAAGLFTICLALRCAEHQPLIWIVEDRAARESGLPYRPGLATQGVAVDRLVLVRTADARMTLWATEEALRAGAPVVVTELWGGRNYDLVAGRRLLLAARQKGTVGLLVHAGVSRAEGLSSPADTRFAVAAHPSSTRASPAQRNSLPGPVTFGVRLLKRRGSATGRLPGFDRDEVHTLAWNRDDRVFTDPAEDFWKNRRARSATA